MAKSDVFYYENLSASAEYAHSAANYLAQCLSDFHADRLTEMLEKMHEFEHAGDLKKRELSEALARAFVTPIDREDIALIASTVDDVTDVIEEALQTVYMYGIKSITPETVEFADKLVECTATMKSMINELPRFKKPAKLHDLIVEVGNAEEECDKLYIEGMANLSATTENVSELIACRELYGKLEECADACEHVADSVDTVVMKNT